MLSVWSELGHSSAAVGPQLDRSWAALHHIVIVQSTSCCIILYMYYIVLCLFHVVVQPVPRKLAIGAWPVSRKCKVSLRSFQFGCCLVTRWSVIVRCLVDVRQCFSFNAVRQDMSVPVIYCQLLLVPVCFLQFRLVSCQPVLLSIVSPYLCLVYVSSGQLVYRPHTVLDFCLYSICIDVVHLYIVSVWPESGRQQAGACFNILLKLSAHCAPYSPHFVFYMYLFSSSMFPKSATIGQRKFQVSPM